MTVQNLIDLGIVELQSCINGLYNLEFTYVTYLKHGGNYGTINSGTVVETHNFIGTIVCDENGNVYKSVVKTYYFVNNNTEVMIGFPQIINKSDKITLDDIFKTDDDGVLYLNVSSLKDINDYTVSNIWRNYIKSTDKSKFRVEKITVRNVACKEYFLETQNRVNVTEFFREQRHNFDTLAKSIKDAGSSIREGLENAGANIAYAIDNHAEVLKYNTNNTWFWHH